MGSGMDQKNLVDKPGCWTNRGYLSDFLDFPISPRRVDSSLLKKLYLEEGRTASQLAEQFGVSKQLVLARLRRAGVHRTKDRGRSPYNFRYRVPPFGYRITADQRLVADRKELAIARFIIE